MLISKSAEQNTMGFRRCLFVSNMCYTLSKVVLLHLVVVSSSVSSLQQSCHDEERSALLQFKESFIINRSASYSDDAYPKILQWKLAEGRNVSCCAWDGIVCDERTGHVIGLDLSSSCLYLGNNSFSGFLPEIYTNTSSLTVIDVSHNQLRGQLPRSLGNCTTLEFIDLSYNKFSDVFPFWLGALPELKEPHQDNVEYFPELRILDLSFNSFRGKFPSQKIFSGNVMRGVPRNQSTYMKVDTNIYSKSTTKLFEEYYSITITSKGVERYYPKIQEALVAIDISSNKFEGRIPEFIGNLKGLMSFNISGNLLTGPIPSSLGNLTWLESLDLSQNKLSGQIPQSLASYEGNPGLCGDPLPKKCGDPKAPRLSPSKTEENDSGSFEFDWKFVLAGLGSGLVVGVVLSDVVITRKREWFVEIVKTIKLMIGNS
ncbi:receptor-like protein 12 [Pyrus ussuriensis x Pyrus communis]|uniref:Receptor-like protein 12 n=1 Tax=Pyrus ussuriensis x Pyrus communis TaxID=2448454 RepID=A0A5N5EWU9_9ROSA|nr:receptor-like protein 12 [Pyrus ussuriensis x Pyrus communis]